MTSLLNITVIFSVLRTRPCGKFCFMIEVKAASTHPAQPCFILYAAPSSLWCYGFALSVASSSWSSHK
jgi:hypothetical protein